jgi:DtxR family transcriptional regulator, manganese transport regulator
MRYHRAPVFSHPVPVAEQLLAARRPSQDSSARFRRTRAAHQDETAEDYVEAIQQISAEQREVRVRDLAVFMGVSHVTVTRIIARLTKAGLVSTEPYKPVSLTPAGRRLADRIRERHEVVLQFLRLIGVPARQAEIDAEGIEHHVSDATIKAMRRAIVAQPGDNSAASLPG